MQAFKQQDGSVYIYNKEKNESFFMKNIMNKYKVVFPDCMLAGVTKGLSCTITEHEVNGMRVWWDMRCWQEPCA
eukprot:11160723-Lingulodinium_polyedra.AAC.1